MLCLVSSLYGLIKRDVIKQHYGEYHNMFEIFIMLSILISFVNLGSFSLLINGTNKVIKMSDLLSDCNFSDFNFFFCVLEKSYGNYGVFDYVIHNNDSIDFNNIHNNDYFGYS